MIAAKTKYFKIKNPDTGEFDSFIFIKGDKGWVIGPDQIARELYDAEDMVPSLALLNSLHSELKQQDDYNNADIINLSKEVWGDPNNPNTLIERVKKNEDSIGTPILHPTLNKSWPVYEIIGSPVGTDTGGVVSIYEWLKELDDRIATLEGN